MPRSTSPAAGPLCGRYGVIPAPAPQPAPHPAASEGPVRAGPAGRRVMDVVREMAPAGATVAQMARAAGSYESRVCEARIVLRHSAELAEAVSAGRIALTTAWRQARQGREKPPMDVDAVTDLSVAELARLLQVCTSTIYTHIKSGRIRADPDRRPLRIPAHAIRGYLVSTSTTSGQEDMLTAGRPARRCGYPPDGSPRRPAKGGSPTSALQAATPRSPGTSAGAMATASLHPPPECPASPRWLR
jgi:excisionase family DNA binding protein